ncbi:phosphatidylserine/phosphatidylglycerophosphate/cardiolipin synthase family protein [Sphingomonas lacunae]|uniref:Phospholipase D n=1 Tax=Sphingomonas lacunae TaxID=2698828 RepID=A0A6M4AQA0_9SPHN|nr:phosphatidylserine/phosphatidylglycerophosphate/cardiolipin synthase family protein [Sphingomonas lacunae]QJQ31187.1 phosphatidylserine/phosphatidylglycerophosphate/cardiolipin synthase family protein [Sphingomonas lacunae]
MTDHPKDPSQTTDRPASDLLRDGFDTLVDGHPISVIPDGPARLIRLLSMIAAAQSTIRMIFYIFDADDSGKAVRDAMTAAARRGVSIDMLLDSFGSARLSDDFFEDLRSAGGRVRWFGTRWTPRYLIRNHQKLVIIDGSSVMTGGFNIADSYFAPAGDPNGWQDLGLVISGPQVPAITKWFDSLSQWMDRDRPRFAALRRLVRTGVPGEGKLRWLVGGPTPLPSPWTSELRRLLASARLLTMSMAYFSPNAGMLRRLARIVRRGGRAELMLAAHSDNAATVGAARLSYRYLLKRGVRIHEFERNRLHNKLLVIDDVVLIGSANLDMRSLFVNMELMLRVEDSAFADRCRALIEAQTHHGSLITYQAHRRREGWLNWLRWSLAWLIVGVIDYSVTRRLNFGLDEDPSLDSGEEDQA